jgi:hypothetical protein
MVKFTKEEQILRNSFLLRPQTREGLRLKEKRRNMTAKRHLTAKSTKPLTLKHVHTAQSSNPFALSKTAKTAKSSKSGKKVKRAKTAKRKLHMSLKATPSHLKQSKNMIRFLNAFLVKYEETDDEEELQKYSEFAALLSAGLYDILGDDAIGNYNDPVDYLTKFRDYLKNYRYEIDPDQINALYNEFLEEYRNLINAKNQYEHVGENIAMGSLFVKEHMQNAQEESVGDEILDMFSGMGL